jgi:hypothetical protein
MKPKGAIANALLGYFNVKGDKNMVKVAHLRETENLQFPKEVVKVIKEIAGILDVEYGEDRNEDSDGGYILVLESRDEFEKLQDVYIDIDTVIVEFVDRIKVENGEDWTNSLVLCNNDFGITLIMPLRITPDNLKDEMIDNE